MTSSEALVIVVYVDVERHVTDGVSVEAQLAVAAGKTRIARANDVGRHDARAGPVAVDHRGELAELPQTGEEECRGREAPIPGTQLDPVVVRVTVGNAETDAAIHGPRSVQQ